MNQLGVQETMTGDLRDEDETRNLPSIQVFPLDHGSVQPQKERALTYDNFSWNNFRTSFPYQSTGDPAGSFRFEIASHPSNSALLALQPGQTSAEPRKRRYPRKTELLENLGRRKQSGACGCTTLSMSVPAEGQFRAAVRIAASLPSFRSITRPASLSVHAT